MESITVIKRIRNPHHSENTDEENMHITELKPGNRFALIRVYLNRKNESLPITEIYVGCRRIVGNYDILNVFKKDEDAKRFAIRNGVEILFD